MNLFTCRSFCLITCLFTVVSAIHYHRPIEGESDCIQDPTEVTVREINRARHHNHSPIVYVLCPNTLFSLSPLDVTTGAITLLTSNSRLLCGPDGSSRNNCAIAGTAPYQIRVPHELEELNIEARVENITVQGITFQEATEGTVTITGRASNVTFEDCVFRLQQRGDFVVHIEEEQPAGTPRDFHRGLQLISDTTKDVLPEHGALDISHIVSESTPSVQIFFRNCRFESNHVRRSLVAAIGGPSNYVEMTHCTFEGNRITGEVNHIFTGGTLLWFADGCSGKLHQNCFQRNYAPLTSVVVGDGTMEVSQNYGDGVTRLEECDDIVRLKRPLFRPLAETLDTQDYECSDFAASTCVGSTTAGSTNTNHPTDDKGMPSGAAYIALTSSVAVAIVLVVSALCFIQAV